MSICRKQGLKNLGKELSFYNIPFIYRLFLLLLLMAFIAGIDRFRNPFSEKWKEYLFLVTCGLLGAIVGGCNDLFTSSVSIDYFQFGKGLLVDSEFKKNVFLLGAEAGFIAGTISSGILLFFNSMGPKSIEILHFKTLFHYVWFSLFCAMLFAFFFFVLFRELDPLRFRDFFTEKKNQTLESFLMVWWIHLGLYVGLFVGTIFGILSIRKKRFSSL